jgi:3-isopropylmalate dehydrogenase
MPSSGKRMECGTILGLQGVGDLDKPVRIALIPGDGAGGEVMAEALPCLDWARSRGRRLELIHLPHGAEHYLATGETLSEAAFEALRDGCDAILFGAVGEIGRAHV